MFSSEQEFAINGDSKENLKSVLKLALELDDKLKGNITHIKSYKIDGKKGLIFGWSDGNGYTKYPMPISLDMAVELAISYLDSSEAEEIYSIKNEPDIDGSIYQGWRVFAPSWSGKDKIDGHFYGIIGIEPEWIIYAK